MTLFSFLAFCDCSCLFVARCLGPAFVVREWPVLLGVFLVGFVFQFLVFTGELYLVCCFY
jgi:hypothetical protein